MNTLTPARKYALKKLGKGAWSESLIQFWIDWYNNELTPTERKLA